MAGPEDVFDIKEILEIKYSRGTFFHLIDWKGFSPKERSWEPLENIDALELIRKVHHCLYLRKRGHKGGDTVRHVGQFVPSPGPLLLLSVWSFLI